ncbi:MAG TPA: hypothetical protein VH482_15630 [Thermomicrobiales bacterium]
MGRHVRCLCALLVVVASVLGPMAGTARAQGAVPAIGYRVLSSGSSSLFLYRFRFQPQASIPGPYDETMLISVVNGTFLLYLGPGARIFLDPRATGSGQVETLTPVGTSGGVTSFNDVAANKGPTFTCAPTCQVRMGAGGLEVVGGPTVGNVAIKLKGATAVSLAGPTPGFVCNTGDAPGRLEVAVAGLTDASQFGWLAYATQQNTAETGAGDLARASGGPSGLKTSLLPARNPGGCDGRTG